MRAYAPLGAPPIPSRGYRPGPDGREFDPSRGGILPQVVIPPCDYGRDTSDESAKHLDNIGGASARRMTLRGAMAAFVDACRT